jgi:hypothetical protein
VLRSTPHRSATQRKCFGLVVFLSPSPRHASHHCAPRRISTQCFGLAILLLRHAPHLTAPPRFALLRSSAHCNATQRLYQMEDFKSWHLSHHSVKPLNRHRN